MLQGKHCHWRAGSCRCTQLCEAAKVKPQALCLLQEEFEEVASIPLPSMAYNVAGQTFVVLARPEGTLATGKLLNTLRFTVKEIDPSTGPAHPYLLNVLADL